MKTILIVDDEPRIAEIARDYLQQAGFKVITASNGTDAVARASLADLIVLDLGLPRMDGLDVTRELRRDSNVPIIMLTARVEESDKLVGLELGADDCVFTRAQLLDAIRGVSAESFERAIDAHIKNLRRKLETDARNPRYILTVYGVGYKFAD